jgi:S1-C subfamily serine protease
VQSAAFSPDGKRVLTASNDNTARLWAADTGQDIAVLKGHSNRVQRAAFSPDGKRVVTASEDSTARLWAAETGQEIAVLKGHSSPVVSASFSPEGKRVVTASEDSTAQIWPLQPSVLVADLIQDAITRVPRCLSLKERQEVFVSPNAPDWCHAKSKHPYKPLRYGISTSAIDAARRKRLRVSAAAGVLVTQVVRDLPAHAAGLQVSDFVTAADGEAISDPRVLSSRLDRVPAGGSIRLTILRSGEQREIILKPGC